MNSVSDPEPCTVTNIKDSESLRSAGRPHLRVDLHGGDVRLPVHVPDHPHVHVAVVQLHAQLGPPGHRGSDVDHVGVGDDHPRVVDDEARAAGQDHVLAERGPCGGAQRRTSAVGTSVGLRQKKDDGRVSVGHLKITSMWTTAGAIFSTTSAMKLQVKRGLQELSGPGGDGGKQAGSQA